jgi:hypothetical protein
MQTLGDLILLLSIGVALWYVPRYLWRVYGGPPIGTWVSALLFTRRDGEAQNIMASSPDQAEKVSSIDPVYIPVDRTGMAGGMEDDDQAMPRIGRALEDMEIVSLLAAQKRAGKYRFSANEIFTLVKGDRNNVLRQVRELREGLPKAEFRTDPEREQWRAEIGLPNR